MIATEVTRRHFLKGLGSVAVGFALGPALLGDIAAAATAAPRQRLRVDPTNQVGDDDAWLVLTPGRTTIYSARVELGTGIQTALTQIVVEELRLGMKRVDFVQGDTVLTPSAGTVGSKSIQQGGPVLRAAAATAYAALLDLAAKHLRVDRSLLVARDGVFTVAGTKRSVTYERLLAQADLLLKVDSAAPVVAPSAYQVVGTDVPRVDLPEKLRATFTYLHDVVVPDMLHGRVIRPTGRNAGNPVVSNLARAQAIPGFVAVVQQGRFVGVVASSEWAAAQAANPQVGITVAWTPGPQLAAQDKLDEALRDPANHYGTFVDVNRGNVDAALASAEHRIEARYFTPYQMHASMGASCAVADVRSAPDPETGIQATIWSATQHVYNLRGALADLLFGAGVEARRVHVRYVEASGCYGHNGADDVAADAALLSKAVGKPVRVQWTRQQEHGWEPLGEAAAHDLAGGVTGGAVVAWAHRLYALTANSRPGNNNGGTLLAGTLLGKAPANLPPNSRNSSGRNAPVTYEFANSRTDSKLVRSFTVPVPGEPPVYKFLRTSALRSLGGFSNSFANESFLDELAHAAGLDPLQLRIDSFTDSRARAVLEALRPAWDTRPKGAGGTGAGVAYQQYETNAAYVATYAEVDVDDDGTVRVRRVVVAHDCGLIVNPDGLRNQIEGNIIQGISRTLKEEVTYNGDRVTSVVWQPVAPFNAPPQYPILRFNEVPTIEIILIDRPDQPAWGSGEPAIGTLGGAVGNAVFAATGKRMRSLPMTPERVRATPVTGAGA